MLNNGNTGTIFITSLVWCGPWLGIEPGSSRTRSQHSTTRLSRRRLTAYDFSHYVSALRKSSGVPKLKCDDWLVGWQDVYSLLDILIPSTYLLLSIPMSIYGSNCLKLLSRLTNCPCFNAYTYVQTCLCTNVSTTLSASSISWTVRLYIVINFTTFVTYTS